VINARISNLTSRLTKARNIAAARWFALDTMYDDNTVQLDTNSDTRTRAHTKNLVVRRCRYDVRKYSFSIRITNIWNRLPDEIISAPSVNTFKNRLDRFWAEQEVFYNYTANITGNKSINL